MILLGSLSFWLALLMVGWTTLVSTVGVRAARADLIESGARALGLSAAALACALGGVLYAAWASDPAVAVATSLAWIEAPLARTVRTLAYVRDVWLLAVASGFALAVVVATRRGSAHHHPRRDAATQAIAGGALCVLLVTGAQAWSPYLNVPARVNIDPTLDAAALGVVFVGHRLLLAAALVLVALHVVCAVAARWQRRRLIAAGPLSVWAWTVATLAVLAGWWWRYPIDGVVLLASREWSVRTAIVVWGVATVALVAAIGAMPRKLPPLRALRWLGGLLVVGGAVGQVLAKESLVEMPQATPRSVRDAIGGTWTFTNQGASFFNRENYQVLALAIDLKRGAERVGLVTTEQRRYATMGDVETPDRVVQGLHRGALQDLFVAVSGSNGPGVALVTARFVPGTSLLFLGGLLLVLGVLPLAASRSEP